MLNMSGGKRKGRGSRLQITKNKQRQQVDLTRGYSQVEREQRMKNYGLLPGLWSPSPALSDEDGWYDDYAKKQRSNKSYY